MSEANGISKREINCSTLTFSIARLTGGLYFGVRELTLALQKEKVDGDVITLEGGWGETLSQAELDDWKALHPRIFPCGWPRKLGYSPKILPALDEVKPDVMHCHGLWHYHLQAASSHGRCNKVPWVVSVHGMLDTWAVRNKEWRKRVASWLYHDAAMSRATCIRALCSAEVEAIRESGFKNPVCLIPNGVELTDENVEAKTHAQIAGWAKGKRILLFLGRIAPKKGLENLMRAWSKVQRDHATAANEWVLVVAGMDEGGHESEVKRLAVELGLEGGVLFPGAQYGAEKTALFHAASAFVLPSYSEGLPMGILQAWAHRLPVLMTPQCNLSEGVAAGAALEILPEAEDIARRLARLFEMSASELAAMGQCGRELVAEKFTWGRVAAQMREVYDWMLGGGDAPVSFERKREFSHA